MKHAKKRTRVHLQYMCLFAFLLLIPAMTSARDSGESQNDLLYEEYGEIEKKMKESYDKQRFDELITMFKEECCKDIGGYDEVKSEVRAFKEKKSFIKEAPNKIRTEIYRLVALSYLKKDKPEPEMGNIYLGKLHYVNKDIFNETFIDISREIKEQFDDGKLYQVIDLYKKYSGSDDRAKTKPGKVIPGFKKVSAKIRADIYQWVALSYDALDRPNIRDIYLEKILDLNLDLRSGDYWPSIKILLEKNYIVHPKFLIGPKTVYFTTYSKVSTETEDFTRSIDLIFGFILEYALTKNLLVSIQPSLIDKGFQLQGEGGSVNNSKRIVFRYVEMPVLISYNFLKRGLSPHLKIGLFYHSLIDAKEFVNGSESSRENIKDEFHPSNWGFLVGGGIGVDIKFSRFGIRYGMEMNYKHGFGYTFKKDNRLQFGNHDVNDIKVSYFEMYVKLLFSIYKTTFKR